MHLDKKTRKIISGFSNNRCYYCGINLKKKWHVDHFFPQNLEHYLNSERMMQSHYKKGNAPVNLNNIHDFRNLCASCPRCNNWKHSSVVSSFRKQIQNLINGLKRSSQFNMAVDFNLVGVLNEPVYFYFEFDEMIKKHKKKFNGNEIILI